MASNPVVLSAVIQGLYSQGRPVEGSQSFSQFIGFGDSNTDSGYYFTHPISSNSSLEAQYQTAVAAGGGLPTTVGGQMNSALLAQDYGLTAIPDGEPGGTNYAASSATVTGSLAGSLAPSVVSQIQTYLASVNNHADPNAVYLVSGGGNDIKNAQLLSGSVAQDNYMIGQAHLLAQAVEQLYAAGARYILLNDHSGTSTSGLGDYFRTTYWSDLAQAGVPVVTEDLNHKVFDAATTNPTLFGLTNVVQPPQGPFTITSYSSANGGATINPLPTQISAGWARYASQNVSASAGETYLWADDEHLSAAGQLVEANYGYSLLQSAVPTVGDTLTASAYVAGNSAPQVIYQWQELLPGQTNWINIGALIPTYVVQSSDVGAQLRVAIISYVTTPGTVQMGYSGATPAVAAAYLATTQNVPMALTSFQGGQTASGVPIVDSAAAVQANLDGLQGMASAGKLTSITLTDSGIPTLSITSAQATSDASVPSAISGNFSVIQTASGSNLTISGVANALGNIVVLPGTASQFAITPTGDGVSLTVGTDHLSNVQALQFSDNTLIVANAPGTSTVTSGNVTELYGAVFGRLPDVAGLNYYTKELAADPALPLTLFAQDFLASPEYTGNSAHNYGQTMAGDIQFITDAYNNLLKRPPGPTDAAWYVANVIAPFLAGQTPGTAAYTAAEKLAHAYVISDFSASAEFLSDVQVTATNPASTAHWLVLI